MRRIHGPRKKFIFKLSTLFIMVFLMVIFFTIKIFDWFSTSISPKLIEVGEMSVEKFVNNFVADFTEFENLSEDDLESLFTVQKNDNNEIIMIDYNMKEIYSIAQALTDNLESSLKSLETGTTNIDYYSGIVGDGYDGFILYLPVGLASDSAYLNQLGPKIPVKITFMGSIFTTISTKVTNYGLNNALLEVYLDIEINYELIIPTTTNKATLTYNTLFAAKVINGKVPEVYGGTLSSSSGVAS